MLYGLSLNQMKNSILRWDTDRQKVVQQPITWASGMETTFDSCMLFNHAGFFAGTGAATAFQQSGNADAYANLISGITSELLDSDPRYIPARGQRMTGEAILSQFFEALGADLADRHPPVPGDGEHMLVVNTPAIMDPEQEARFLRCVEKSGIPAQVQPGWFLQTLACIMDHPDFRTGRFLFLDFGQDESCAVAMLISEDSGHRFTPRSIAVSPMSHRETANWILEALCSGSDTYVSSMVPWGFHSKKDYLTLREEAERVRCGLMDKKKRIDFSVPSLYQNQYLEADGLTNAWMVSLLESKNYPLLVHSMIDQAMMEAGWSSEKLDGIYITRSSGRIFRQIALAHLGIAEGDPRCPIWNGNGSQTAEGAAIAAKLTCVGHTLQRDPVTRFHLCCRTSREREDRLWHYGALFRQGTFRVPCGGASFVEFFALDAAISPDEMSNNRGSWQLCRLNVPAGTNVTLTVHLDGVGGCVCIFTSGARTLHTESFQVNLGDA